MDKIELIKYLADNILTTDLLEGWAKDEIKELEKLRDGNFNIMNKHIYEISNYWYDEEIMDNHYGFLYLQSDREYSQDEFWRLCEEIGKEHGNDNVYDILISKYRFERMEITSKYEYEEE